jgi:hypothetical protein
MAADADQAHDAEQPAAEYRYLESGLHLMLLRFSRITKLSLAVIAEWVPDPEPLSSPLRADLWLGCARRIGLGYGVGVAWMVQFTPFQRSINCSAELAEISDSPTAMHEVGEVHDTAARPSSAPSMSIPE